MARHHFHLQASWPGLRNDVGTIECAQLKTEISIPKEMDGPGIGTNQMRCSRCSGHMLYHYTCSHDGAESIRERGSIDEL